MFNFVEKNKTMNNEMLAQFETTLQKLNKMVDIDPVTMINVWGAIAKARAILPISQTCSKCGEDKPIYEFGLDKKRKNGYHHWCKCCVSLSNKEYYRLHPDKKKKYNKEYDTEYRKLNRDKLNEYLKEYNKKRYRERPDVREYYNNYSREYKKRNKLIT
jgi:recombinational DNA repair protein (RecF pathway)